jgi:lysozyme family protein
VFRKFVDALEGASPVITMENMNDLLSLCNEFGFTGLLSQVTDFIAAHSVVDYEARKWVSDLKEKSQQQDRKLCLPQREIVDLRDANNRQLQDIAEIQEGRSREVTELSRLGCENASLTQASRVQKQELGAAQANSDKELRAQFAQKAGKGARGARAGDLEALRKQQSGSQTRIAQELANLKQQLTQLHGAPSSSDTKIDNLNRQLTSKIANLAQDFQNLKEQFTQFANAQSSSDKKVANLGLSWCRQRKRLEV